MAEQDITPNRVREVLRLDRETGVLCWVVSTGRSPAGALAGCKHKNGYTYLKIDGHSCMAHRIVWLLLYGQWPDQHIDHINGSRSDNRPGNLRKATRSQQAQNKIGWPKRSLPKGVYPDGGRYAAAIHRNGRKQHLGMFATPSEAHAAYCEAASADFGEFFCGGSRLTTP